VQKHAPSVKRVVVTSSFAAINNVYAKAKGKVYSEVISKSIDLFSSIEADQSVG
jgi:hypothetical protein